MVITIQIQNHKDYQWLLPFLEALKKTNVKVEVKGNLPEQEDFVTKRKAFLNFFKQNAIPVEKVEIPNREDRNAR